jgi:hypothetical protein
VKNRENTKLKECVKFNGSLEMKRGSKKEGRIKGNFLSHRYLHPKPISITSS